MAEKYGEVPKRFTKAWWSYFWYYNKYKVMGIGAAVILAAITITQCVSREKFDIYIVYAGHVHYSDRMAQKLEEVAEQYVSDIDKNDKQSVMFQQMMFSDKAGSEQYDSAIQTKLDFTFTDDRKFLYLMDDVQASIYLQRDSVSRMFENTEDWAQGTTAEILKAPDGTGYAVNLSNSTLLRQNDIYCENLYLMIRKNNKSGDENEQAYEDSLKLAKELIK